MASEESKPAKKGKVEMDDSEDGMSLGSLLQDRKKKASNVGSNSSSLSKIKKEELQGDEKVGKSPKTNSGSASKTTKIKKQERFDYSDDDNDNKPIKKSTVAKRDMELKKKKKVKEEVKKSKNSKVEIESKKSGKKVKKVYDLPGQKRDPPEERDSLRIFYESLYKQLPHSEMAQVWMMESGLLPKEVAKKVYEKKQKKTQLQKISSPTKTTSSIKSVTKTSVVKKKTLSSPISSNKKMTSPVSSNKKTTTVSQVTAKQSKKRKSKDESSEDESDDDFVISRSMKKKPRAV